MSGAVATVMERAEDGSYTGHVEGEVVEGSVKPIAAARWSDEHLGEGNWTLAYAYGDHKSDVPLLEMAEEPFAVTPKKKLSPVAKRKGWTIVEWGE